MAFWTGIAIGAAFAWYAIKTGFYEVWATLFNLVISIYLSIFLKPVVADFVPMAGDSPYTTAIIVIATATAAFLILQGISYIFFTGQFSVSFPKMLDILGSGVVGFLAGYLVWNFAAFLIFTTPISENDFVKELGFNGQFKQVNFAYISWWCNHVNKVVSTKDSEYQTAEKAISELLKSSNKKTVKSTGPAEPNSPAEPNEPNKPMKPSGKYVKEKHTCPPNPDTNGK